MLQSFRLIINSLVGKVFFGILLATFSLVGVGYGIRDLLLGDTNSTNAATVGDAQITLQAFAQQYHRQLLNYQRQLGASFNPTPQQRQEIAHDTLDHAVTEALFGEVARRDGIAVDDSMIRRIIESEPAFAGMDKRFDPVEFKMRLEGEGLTEAAFVASVRASLSRQLVSNPVAGSAIAPRALGEDIYRYRNEQRVAQIITLPNAAATGVPTPTDAELKAFYDKHQVEFTAPEYRSFTVLSLTPDLFTDEINPSPDDVKAAYEAHKSEYVDPEKRKIDQVVLADQATAEAVAKAAQSGKSLADAAKTASGGKSQPIALDFLARDAFPQALQDPVFAAEKGAIVGPIETPLGWHVVQVDDIQAGHDIPFDQVKDKLVQDLKHDGAVDRLSEQIDRIGDKLSGGAPMDQVAAGVNAKLIAIAAVDAKGQPATPQPDTSPKPNPAWTETAFTLRQGDTSPVQTGKDGSYFAVRLDAVTPPALKPLADVRAELVTAWTDEQKAARTAGLAAEIESKAKSGTPLDQLATKAGAKVTTTPPVTRDATAKTEGAPPLPVIDALFDLTRIGEITTVDAGDAQVVVKLSEIRPADPFAAGPKMAALTQEIDAAMQSDALAQYRAALEQSVKVKINPQAVETVAGQ